MGSCEVEPRMETPDMARIQGAPGRPPRIPAGGQVQDPLGDACGLAARATSRIRGPARRRGSPWRSSRTTPPTGEPAAHGRAGGGSRRADSGSAGTASRSDPPPGRFARTGGDTRRLSRPSLDELVQVERGQRAADADLFGRFVSAHGIGVALHELVQPSSRGLAEGGHRLELAWDPWHLHGRMVRRRGTSP